MADWDERYRRGEHAGLEPGRLLKRVAATLPPGRALDIACGAGRHALYLAERGWRVTAVDASRVGVELAVQRARERGVGLDARVADLERGEFVIEPHGYDLICIFYYLQRDLFPQIRAGVRPGGVVAAAIHIVDDHLRAKPMNPDFLLRAGELREAFRGWEILHYHETAKHDDDPGEHQRRTAEIIARRALDDATASSGV